MRIYYPKREATLVLTKYSKKMKTKFQVNDIVEIVDVKKLDCYNPETGAKDIFLGDKFEVLEVIEYSQEECDLLVKSLNSEVEMIMNSERFILA